jgi:hypothetical protein
VIAAVSSTAATAVRRLHRGQVFGSTALINDKYPMSPAPFGKTPAIAADTG